MLSVKSLFFVLSIVANQIYGESIQDGDLSECVIHNVLYEFEYLYASSKSKTSINPLLKVKNFENIRWSFEPTLDKVKFSLNKVGQ
jgi:hypothetical protein